MQFGVFTYPTHRSALSPAELAVALEERGFESLFLPEHTHIPVSRRTPYPGGPELPEEYKQMLDPLIGLATAASVTSRLLLGTAVCLPNERDVISMAKEVSTLDLLSGGRVVLGVGAGWNVEELENHGGDPKRKWSSLRERVLAMKEIWTNEVAEHHGEFVNFEALWQWPKPVQAPHPPVLIGGHGRRSLERVVEYGDGWIPTAAKEREAMGSQIALLQELAAKRGRGHIPVTVLGARPDPDVLSHYAEVGVDRCVFWQMPDDRTKCLDRLDRCVTLMEKVA